MRLWLWWEDIITDALARNDSIKTPEDLVKEIIQNGL